MLKQCHVVSRCLQVHGWLMCLAWGALIPIGVVIATFRTVWGAGAWWFHMHRLLNTLGLLVSLAGLSVGVYLSPGEGGLTWKHKIIGITVNVLAVGQVCCSHITPLLDCTVAVTCSHIFRRQHHCSVFLHAWGALDTANAVQ